MIATPLRLLLVDDDPLQLKLMKLTLEERGYAVTTAQDGQAALELLPLYPSDGVISDVLMPRVDGFQLCRALRKDHRFSELSIVLVTAASIEPQDQRLANDAGANALLPRTANIKELARQAIEGLKTPADLQERLNQMEEKLRHSQKLASIGQLAAGVAHELNNPLSAILGFVDCLIRKPATPDLSNILRTMQSEGLRCRTLILDMLAFTRKPADQTAWEHLPLVVDGILGLIGARAKTMQVVVEKHYEKGLPNALVNGNQIQQVLINLCGNALDSMPKGGTLSVSVTLAGNDFVLRVSDTGEGIPPERFKRIFEPFFTTKEAGKGTGLGLSLVQEIVTAHKGRIEVQSEVGLGTTFKVILPLDGTS